MKISDLLSNEKFSLICGDDTDREITSLTSCDLLSWVMANGKEDAAWITVQAHMNIIAVASLLDFSCVILPESIKVDEAIVEKATEQDVAIISTDLDAFGIFKVMYEMGLR